MNFRHLEVFRAVMISGSASRAAELLQITQPAVSRALSDLEASLGFNLYDRVRGRLVPTPEGQLFFRDVNTSFVGLDRLRASAAQIRDFGSGSLRIASHAALGSALVPRAIASFRAKHPKIAITLQTPSSTAVRDLVVHQQFDVGLAADEVDLSGVDHRVFGNFRALCAMPPGHPLAQEPVIRPEHLQGVPFIALAPEDRARGRLAKILEAAEVHPEIVVETPSSSTVCALVLEGAGVGLINPCSAHGFSERGVIFRPFEPEVLFRSYLLFRPDAQRARHVNAFVAELLKARAGIVKSTGS
ncbi:MULTISPECIES: LysR substrate-binding domain-containing protein [unclassified Caulobacter]|uniref:LysR substrate-binding domain-containing protein n=1 Tax=unclassified Caulobacter TaxID=2648921 RepID=UPI000785D034|nr:MULTISPECIES: LysR substrate-binding domain-containing protein [unclassified Caulobacter]AZS21803.1 LysR family transcriptional regulator [Caulobacter sp. FWC26]